MLATLHKATLVLFHVVEGVSGQFMAMKRTTRRHGTTRKSWMQ